MSRFVARLEPVALAELRPTQVTVGYREVLAKRRAWRAKPAEEQQAFLVRKATPTVLGPGGRHYIIDQHHLTRALFEEGEAEIFACPVADFSHLAESAFWSRMDESRWVHPFDAAGRRIRYADLPASVGDLVDDPFRSLATLVRRAGGFAKDRRPYSEFSWADFFRQRIDPPGLTAALGGELGAIVTLARSFDASHLPGWRGAA
jgi:hypothetical protein